MAKTPTPLRVKELAQAKGWNIQKLTDATGLAYSVVHGLWHDRVIQFNRNTLDTIAKALEVPVGDLFGTASEDETLGQSSPSLLLSA